MSRRPAGALVAFGIGLLAGLSGPVVPSAVGQQKPLVVPPAPQAPTLTTPVTLGVKRGVAVELALSGTNLADPVGVSLSCPGTAAVVADPKPNPAAVRVKVEVPADTPVGLYTVRVATKAGVSNARPLLVDDLDGVAETESNRSKETAQPVPNPGVVSGRADPEAADYFRVKVAAGKRLTVEVVARRAGSPMDPIVVLHDGATKRELVDKYADDTPGMQSDCRLVYTPPKDGEVIVEVRDTTYRGGGDYFYRLRVGDFPGAMTAFPLALQRGQAAAVGFAGLIAEDVPAVPVTAPAEPWRAAVQVVPQRQTGTSGWPVPVRLTDDPQAVEREPNDDPAKAQRLPVPGGVSAMFRTKNDKDHFVVAGKKGQKLTVTALAYEVNAPTEVLFKVLDAKGAEVARSDPQKVPARAEFTPAADGDFTIACEHLNYLHGPTEVYHLSVEPAVPDVTVALALDRCEAPAGGGTAFGATVNRLNGFAGPVALSVEGAGVAGRVVVPAGQTQAFIPVAVLDGLRPGAVPFRVKATFVADGRAVERYATAPDVVRATFGGLPNLPTELLSGCALGVVEKPPFGVTLAAEPGAFEKGKAGKLLVEATRADGFAEDVAVAALFAPANVAVAVKPVPKGQTKADGTVTPAPAAATGATQVVVRATGKVGGKDYAVTPPPLLVEVIEPKKVEPKKVDPPAPPKK